MTNLETHTPTARRPLIRSLLNSTGAERQRVIQDLLATAIAGRRVVKIAYGPGWRTVEPHALGTSAKGDELLRAWQVAGESESGGTEGWKLFRADRINGVCVSDDCFEPRPGYSPEDRQMKGGVLECV